MHELYGDEAGQHPPFPGDWIDQPDWFIEDYMTIEWRYQVAKEVHKPGLGTAGERGH